MSTSNIYCESVLKQSLAVSGHTEATETLKGGLDNINGTIEEGNKQNKSYKLFVNEMKVHVKTEIQFVIYLVI